MQSNVARSVKISISGKPDNCSLSKCCNTEGKTQQISAVYTHLQQKQHALRDHHVHILDREDGWFVRGVKEAITIKVEQLSLNRGEGLRHHLSSAYNAGLKTVYPRFMDKPICFTFFSGSKHSGHYISHKSCDFIPSALSCDFFVCIYWPEILPVATLQLMMVLG